MIRPVQTCLGPLLALLACLAFAQPAGAQLPSPYPGIDVPNYAAIIAQDTFLRQSLGQPGSAAREPTAKERKKARKKAKKKPDPKPTARQRATLRFGTDATASSSVDRFFLDNFAAPGVPHETVLADLARLRTLGETDMRQMRWSTRNLGDVAAFSLLVAYLSVNDERTLNVKGAAVVRRAVVDELALMTSVRRLSDARQQELAETLLLRTGYYVGWRNDLQAKGDSSGAESLRQKLRDYVTRVYGIDPTTVRLGSRGFRKR